MTRPPASCPPCQYPCPKTANEIWVRMSNGSAMTVLTHRRDHFYTLNHCHWHIKCEFVYSKGPPLSLKYNGCLGFLISSSSNPYCSLNMTYLPLPLSIPQGIIPPCKHYVFLSIIIIDTLYKAPGVEK